MATVTFDLQDLKSHGISKEDVVEVVDRLGMSLDGLDDKEALIDITPNRPDLLDIVGFARAAKFLLGKSVPKEKAYSTDNNPILKVNVIGKSPIQPFIAAAVVKNVDLSGNKLKNLINFTEKFCDTYGRRRRKLSMGLYNFDTLSGPLTYTASKEGEFVPLGTSKKSNLQEILNEHEKGKTYSEILGKHKNYPLLSDSKGIIALIPIVNSEGTKVTTTTKNLFIDITANTKHAAESAMNMFVCSFIDMGAEIYPCEIVYKTGTTITPDLEYKSYRIRRSKAENTLGFYLQENKVVNLTNKLGHVAGKYGLDTMVYVPPYRLDVMNDQDIIEDIAIGYGYDNIAPMPLTSSCVGKADELKEYSNRVCKLMIGMGFTEAMNFYLTNEIQNFNKFEIKKHDEKSIIKVAYAKTEAITMLRTHILPELMENLSNSIHDKMPQKMFEVGSVFSLKGAKVVEQTNFAIVSEHTKANFSEIKSVVLEYLKFSGIKDYTLKEFDHPAFIQGRAAEIIYQNESIGYFGEINPKVLNNFKLEEPVVAAEIIIHI
jgi:phenylalanyl-tRNA synthetase beta chain